MNDDYKDKISEETTDDNNTEGDYLNNDKNAYPSKVEKEKKKLDDSVYNIPKKTGLTFQEFEELFLSSKDVERE
ncbi:MAG: hypothetical protein WC879_01720 [Melioribacteraceae bacterium]